MKNKTRGILCFFLILVLSVNFSIAALNETQVTERTNQAYSWLNHETAGNSSKISSQDNSFLLLALAYDTQLATELKTSLLAQSQSNKCWPKDGCSVRDTSLAALSLQRICNSNVDIDNWILNQTATPTELSWYLQVEANGNASCTISYDGDHDFKLSDNKKIDKSAGSCLSLSNDGYWFKVNPSCYAKTFSVTCTLGNVQDQFLTSWLYQKPSDIAYYVSSDTQKESSGGVIDVGINAKCFKSGTSCDYEATAWTALYLLKAGQDIGVFLPYLIGYADKNSAKLPEAFLYVLTGDENYAEQLLLKQKSTGYWQAATANNKYYDTALALMALKEYTSASELIDKAKSWLIKEAKAEKIDNQVTYVSWGTSKKDTAFILYSVWPKAPSCIDKTVFGCEEMGFDCVMTDSCEEGETADYFCTYASKVCCKQVVEKKTCAELGGKFCGYFTETCDGRDELTDAGTCCLGTCTPKPSSEKTDCEKKYNICLSSCGEGYESTTDACDGIKVCCKEAESPERNLAWLWILLGVILLVALILLFLNYQKKKSVSGFKPRPSQGSGGYPPYSPPASGGVRRQQPAPAPQFRTMIPARGIPQRQPASRSQTDKELDDTLKRVRQIAG